MMRIALALALGVALFPQERPPEPPRKMDPDDLKRKERELSAQLEKTTRAREEAAAAGNEKRAAELAREVERIEQQLNDVRAMMKRPEKFPPKEVERDRRVDELNSLKKQLGDPSLSDDEKADLKLRIAALQDQIDRGKRDRLPPDAMGHPPELDRRLLQEVRDWAKEFEPDTARRIQDLLDAKRPEELARTVTDARRRMDELNDLRESNPEEYRRRVEIAKMERDAWAMSDRLRKADEKDRPVLKQELVAALTRLFDMREEQRARELAELERRVAELRKALERRQENKTRIIEKRAQDMMGEEFDW